MTSPIPVGGLCAETDPEVFFPGKGESATDAKRVCMACSVRAACLAAAVARGEQHGVWGGLSYRERLPLVAAARAAAAARLVA
jgi:WhiB family transcriptional regulator, redox-sensing transcriptional regulator